MITQFLMDGIAYNVQVISLKRTFEIKEGITARATQSGAIYRNLLGTYYNYTITVRERGGDREAFDAFWDAVSQPVASHDCVFPYNQSTIKQRMYVKNGSQQIIRLHENGADWHDITVQFIAQTPKVVPDEP